MTIIAAADGSALGNPGPAGWGWYSDDDHWACGGWPHGTNNMGELTAVLDLLQQTAHLDEDLLIYCDSTYVINSVTKWMAGWKRKGWKKGDGKPVLNVEIMKALDAAMRPNVRFEWVKGHAGHPLNEQADRLANAAAASWKDGVAPHPGPGYGSAPAPSVPDHTAYQVGQTAPEEDLFSLAGEAVVQLSDEEQVISLERSLLTDDVRRDRAAVAALLHPEWAEIGASGRIWSRAEMLDEVAPLKETGLDVIRAEPVAADAILLLWRSSSDDGSDVRSSLWVRDGNRWVQRFHQGTPER